MGSSSSTDYDDKRRNAVQYLEEFAEEEFLIDDYKYYSLNGLLSYVDGILPGSYWWEHWYVLLMGEDGRYLVLDYLQTGITVRPKFYALRYKHKSYSLPSKYIERARVGKKIKGKVLAKELKSWQDKCYYKWNQRNCQDFLKWFA
eukprot:scaffold5517_cov228-Ochromonas_danica.AAC.4